MFLYFFNVDNRKLKLLMWLMFLCVCVLDSTAIINITCSRYNPKLLDLQRNRKM